MRFVLIPPGEFLMGSPTSEVDHGSEETLHHVRLTKGFYLAAHEVTNAQYRLFDAGHASTFNGDQQPATQVSHDDATAFAVWLSGQTGDTYGLPTEAQWECACRATTTTPFSFGPNITPAHVNYDGDFPYNGAPTGLDRGETTDVGIFPANAWGLYDMHGNVYEWCADWHDTYPTGPVTEDPMGPASGLFRVLRGGSWGAGARFARSAYRTRLDPGGRSNNIGFRPARPVTP
jgi:formylglycine-generating enzyme required for sulfatase activity